MNYSQCFVQTYYHDKLEPTACELLNDNSAIKQLQLVFSTEILKQYGCKN